MSRLPAPPPIHREFTTRFPKLAQAWDVLGQAGLEGPLEEKFARLVKLAVAVGAMREGAVHSSARKARAAGATEAEIDQLVALAASVLGLPSTVAIYTWLREKKAP